VQEIEQQYRQTVDQAQQTATETADAVASATSTGAIFAFVALVLGVRSLPLWRSFSVQSPVGSEVGLASSILSLPTG
jgi:hypothetical protein